MPVAHKTLDGNTAEATTHLDNLRRLKEILPKQRLLYIADTKQDTPENLLTVATRAGQFLFGGAFSPELQRLFLQNRSKLCTVDYYPKSQAHLPAEKRDQYQAFELKDRLEGMVVGRKSLIGVPPELRVEPGQGATVGKDARVSRGQDPRGVLGR